MEEEKWAIVELMGHVRLAGRLSEEEKFGSKLGRIDIPKGESFVTQYFGASSVYRITLCTEETARAAGSLNNVPMGIWDIREYLQPMVESKLLEMKEESAEEEAEFVG